MSFGSSSIWTLTCTNSASARRLRARSSGLSPSFTSTEGCFFWNSSVNFFSVRLPGWRLSIGPVEPASSWSFSPSSILPSRT